MKKAVLIVSFLFISANGFSQGMPVYDNVNFISFIKQLLEAGKQTSEILKQVKFLKQAKEAYDKVSGSIKQFKTMERVLQKNEAIYKLMSDDLRTIISSKYVTAEEASRIYDEFQMLYEKSNDDLDFIGKLLKNDFLKMQDADRYKLLKEKETESNEMYRRLRYKTKKLTKVIELREFNDKMNKRQTGI